MGEDWGSCYPRQQFDWQSSNLNYLGAPFNVEHHRTIPSVMNPGSDMVSIKGTLPAYPSFDPPYSFVAQANEPHGWFYCLPRFRHAFAPSLNSGFKERLPAAANGNNKEVFTPKVESGCSQKRFLVFDQSGDQTTLIFSSGIGTPVPGFTSWGRKPTGACNLKREDPGTKENLNIHLRAIAPDQLGENDGADLQSEMHEDTDELNALLYSDDDSDYTEDDEVTSTGHSPSTMTAHNNQDWFKGSTEEVASSGGSTKKRKLFDGGFSDVPALMDTANSVKPVISFEYENDAESRCDDGLYWASSEMGSESSNKKMRKEKIRDTVNILQNIIPGGKGKDAIVVLDEAIGYLKSLKVKAKALGLDAP
ncbi:transcription factor bHLH143 [Ricinus communis]|nr:transcription factor bHLH143 [Ricinus communis]|eukprot:XP_015571558.1 transcription factor bHLH143 [Ricinus communis]